MATLLLASGTAFSPEHQERSRDAVRATLGAQPANVVAGASCPHPQALALRALAPLVETLMASLQQVG